MNFTTAISISGTMEPVVKFTAPKPGWKLEEVLIMATDGWNSTSKEQPGPLPFTLEVRDDTSGLLYHYEGVQLPYFTSNVPGEIRMATIELPAIPVSNDFYVCFNGYGNLYLGAELDNITGNSYYYDMRNGDLYKGFIPLTNNKNIPVNWLIRAAGE